jgi:pSer/pThr/pTyr-binding forkhead associated (FHA) protein
MGTCYLALEEGANRKTLYPLGEETWIVRSPANAISLDDPIVSRYHAKVSCQNGIWSIEDLGSTNGIIFDGNRVDKMVLNSGDVFQIGKTTCRFSEEKVQKGSDQLFQTIEILSSTGEEQSFLAEEGGSESWQQRIQKAIDRIPFFSPINEAECKRLIVTGSLYLFNTGESIIREGDSDRSIYIILDGRVRVFTQDYEDKEFDLAVLGPSDFFGEISFLTGKPRSSSVAALENSVIIEFTHENMEELVKKHPAVKKTLSEYCQDRQADLEEKRIKKVLMNDRQSVSPSR